ncbi:MAG: hypothetical protein H7840_03035 [Alphaproteobacteria bacterium]
MAAPEWQRLRRRQQRREAAARVLFVVNLCGLIATTGYAGALLAVRLPTLAAAGGVSFFLGLLVPALKEFLHMRRDYDAVADTFLRHHGAAPPPRQEVLSPSENVLFQSASIPVMLAFWFAALGLGLVAAEVARGP